MHLTYTRSYWERMCGTVLDRPLHHEPTKGGSTEGDKFNDWYERTKQAYAAAFDDAPPEDLWPPSEERFGRDIRWQRVNLATSWVIPRARASAGVGALAFLVGCSATTMGPAILADSGGGLAIAGIVGVVTLTAGLAVRTRRHNARRFNIGFGILLVGAIALVTMLGLSIFGATLPVWPLVLAGLITTGGTLLQVPWELGARATDIPKISRPVKSGDVDYPYDSSRSPPEIDDRGGCSGCSAAGCGGGCGSE